MRIQQLSYYEPNHKGGKANVCFAVHNKTLDQAGVWDKMVKDAFYSLAVLKEVECGSGGFEGSMGEMTDKELVRQLKLPPRALPAVWCGSKRAVSPFLKKLEETHEVFCGDGRIVGLTKRPLDEF